MWNGRVRRCDVSGRTGWERVKNVIDGFVLSRDDRSMFMMHLFAYGTLEIPDVMEAITGKTWTSAEARANGFAKFLLKGRIYPGMTAVKGATCSGRIYYHIDRRTLEILDAFEDEVYTRACIDVAVSDGRSLPAHAYLIPPLHRNCLASTPWRPDEFMTRHLVAYLEACNVFRREIEGGPSAIPKLEKP